MKRYLAALWPALGHFWGDILANLKLITATCFWFHVSPRGLHEPYSEVWLAKLVNPINIVIGTGLLGEAHT